ncbi:MAG TPA: LPXTG cell wall anchor domain-containing protein [Thermoanaerobaculia bacterium]|nr:LPXTG cell wall anchor domain-containing protein [Thermoanaerobaculia bacterium]
MKRRFGFSFLAAAAAAFLSVSARADTAWRSPLVIGEPTEIPGTVLQPGRYLVRVLDTQETRKVVQFMNADESAVIATVMGIPDYRVETAQRNEFVYFQRAEGAPQALKSWRYPGNSFGIEFVYPKAEAVQLAQARHEEVYSAPSAKPEAKEPVVAISPELKEKPVEMKAPPPPAPTAVPAPAPPPAPAAPAPKKAKKLPKTGSPLPLVALAGAAALAAGSALRLLRRI